MHIARESNACALLATGLGCLYGEEEKYAYTSFYSTNLLILMRWPKMYRRTLLFESNLQQNAIPVAATFKLEVSSWDFPGLSGLFPTTKAKTKQKINCKPTFF